MCIIQQAIFFANCKYGFKQDVVTLVIKLTMIRIMNIVKLSINFSIRCFQPARHWPYYIVSPLIARKNSERYIFPSRIQRNMTSN
jgi:hypothetical protein